MNKKKWSWKIGIKYSPDQARVSAGDPRGGQWTSSGGGGRSPFATGPIKSTFHTDNFNEQEESEAILRPGQGQSSSLRPGITRDQAQRFYARLNAARTAASTKYRNSTETVAELVDNAIANGHTEYSATSRWTKLTRPSDGSAFQYSGKIERDYINVALNRGDMKRNY